MGMNSLVTNRADFRTLDYQWIMETYGLNSWPGEKEEDIYGYEQFGYKKRCLRTLDHQWIMETYGLNLKWKGALWCNGSLDQSLMVDQLVQHDCYNKAVVCAIPSVGLCI